MINMFEVYKFESLSKDDKLTVILIILIGILIFYNIVLADVFVHKRIERQGEKIRH